ncbi:hypothetical protein [Sphingomonas sp. BK235]|uniref:hypothetical protein n=1 Tax=Sphingomonas sp. BK235 TaxID=2512131 RepID=UPI0010D397DF|nr:hypothetical protein [Sphingomonas sp. BK235]TCP36552.1 hypothetical protein EV292_10148 [Sphingomonas sp. BK235]
MAWLNATPKPPPGSRRDDANRQAQRLSRIDQLKKDKAPIPMPPNPAPHITGWLIAMGIVQPTGMSIAALGWAEIAGWQQSMCIRLTPWEASLLRNLSSAYVAETRRAESELCSAPWQVAVTQREIDAEMARLELVLGGGDDDE